MINFTPDPGGFLVILDIHRGFNVLLMILDKNSAYVVLGSKTSIEVTFVSVLGSHNNVSVLILLS